MTLRLKRLLALFLIVLCLEAACRFGLIHRTILVPPTEAAAYLAELLWSGAIVGDLSYTLLNILAAILASVVFGFLIGVAIHQVPRLQSILNPFLASYYAVPIFVFYPMLIVIFGLNRIPLILIGVMFGIVAMIVSTMNGLQRVPRAYVKTARIMKLGAIKKLILVSLPAAAPYFLTGVKLAVIYSVLATIAGEFLLSARGAGFKIAFAFNSFDARTMYAVLLFIITLVAIIVLSLHAWEKKLHQRWGRE